MTTFVIGNKLNPIIPDIKPLFIIVANGAINLIEEKFHPKVILR